MLHLKIYTLIKIFISGTEGLAPSGVNHYHSKPPTPRSARQVNRYKLVNYQFQDF